ncbi:hypothetical protein GCM10010392_21990 [Streptomyces clavifer]|nr:hypothetical protein GCM10010392_21990 [Streptomyces clavifer]
MRHLHTPRPAAENEETADSRCMRPGATVRPRPPVPAEAEEAAIDLVATSSHGSGRRAPTRTVRWTVLSVAAY